MKKILLFGFIFFLITGCGCENKKIDIDYEKILLEEYGREFTNLDFITSIIFDEVEAVRLFLEAGMDPDSLDATGRRVMYTAIASDSIESIQLLADYGADLDYVNDYGVNYMYFASINRQDCKTLEKLAEIGVEVNFKTTTGDTPLGAAIGQQQYTPEYKVQEDCLRALGATD